MNLITLRVIALSMLAVPVTFSKEITVQYQGSTFTMNTDSIDNNPSLSDEQKKHASNYLENCKTANISPFLWENKISSSEGLGQKTEIFWRIEMTRGPGQWWMREKMPTNFISHDKALDVTQCIVFIEMFADNTPSEIRLVLETKDGYFVFGRSTCIVKPGFIQDLCKAKVGTSSEAKWGQLESRGVTIDTLPLIIKPEMKEALKKVVRPDTKIIVGQVSENKQKFTK